jgi:alkylhydroperoxidase family enzyme
MPALLRPASRPASPPLSRPDVGGHALRLSPIENPKGLKLRLLYWMSRRQFGVVPTPLKVVAPRFPAVLKLSMGLQGFERKLRLPAELRLLVGAVVSSINGCGFCLDLKHMMAVRKDLSLAKFNALPQRQASPLFSERERAAFRYAEEVTVQRRPRDETFEALRRHFAEWEIVELTYVIALENFVNLGNIPLGLGSDGLCALAQGRAR